jgi:ATP-binding cassette subfamily B protein
MISFPEYHLGTRDRKAQSFWQQLSGTLRAMFGYLEEERAKLAIVLVCLLISTIATVLTPYFVARGIDVYIAQRDLRGLVLMLAGLMVIYVVSSLCGYFQLQIMGRVSQLVLFRVRNHVFSHIQSLPIAFFHQNKAGDLISRINNDTDKVNQFLSEFLIRFTATFITLLGIGVFVFLLNVRMSLVMLASAVIIVVSTRVFSGWVQRTNKQSLEAEGALSGEIQESLDNFKVLVAFHRQDYFLESVQRVNEQSRMGLFRAQIASGIFNPLYNAAGNLAQVAILVYGVYLMQTGQFTAGLLIGFLVYAQKFYEPLRILGVMWGNFQSTMAAWSRIEEILRLTSSLKVIK